MDDRRSKTEDSRPETEKEGQRTPARWLIQSVRQGRGRREEGRIIMYRIDNYSAKICRKSAGLCDKFLSMLKTTRNLFGSEYMILELTEYEKS